MELPKRMIDMPWGFVFQVSPIFLKLWIYIYMYIYIYVYIYICVYIYIFYGKTNGIPYKYTSMGGFRFIGIFPSHPLRNRIFPRLGGFFGALG